MSLEIILVLAILLASLVLFITAWVRMDIVALLVVGTLAVTGLITPQEALSGFSNPAVVTVWAMFIISAALYQTGVAGLIGRQLVKMAGGGEARLIAMIILSTGIMSAFMNNIGVAALMLPVVMDISRSKGVSPSRLLMPLAFGSLLGGLTTLIGTPSNLLVSYALEDAGLEPFKLFSYTPVGFGVLLAGTIFFTFAGRHLLPKRDALAETGEQQSKILSASYALQERTFMIRVKPASNLAGKTLAESRLRAGLGINVVTVIKQYQKVLDPGPETVIEANDKLFVQGRVEVLKAMKNWKVIVPEQSGIKNNQLLQHDLQIYESTIASKSPLIGKHLQDTEFRKRYGLNVLAVITQDGVLHYNLYDIVLDSAQKLLLQGPLERLELLEKDGQIEEIIKVDSDKLIRHYKLDELLFIMEVSDNELLFQQAITESQIGSAFGLTVLGILDKDKNLTPYSPGTQIQAMDHLLVKGNIEDLPLLQGIAELEILDERAPGVQTLESEKILIAEAVLAPRSLLAGKTLREINFRKKYGLTVLAIWREGRAYRTNLHNMPLRFGEALLVYGERENLELLKEETDFILLTEMDQKPRRTGKALTSGLIMAGILLPVLFGFVPLAIAALIGIALMVLTGCLRMEEAYRAIEWRSVFLIAGMLPLGTALQQTGAATMMAQGVVELFGRFGPWGIIAGLYMLTSISTIAIHPAALVVIMSPIAIEAAASYDISPYTLMMAIAIAAAACFMSPVSHPANLLVMGPGGYKFSDYLKVGLPLTLVVMAVSMLLLPIFWPI